MTDLGKDEALTSADLAGAGPAPEFEPEPGPPERREYVAAKTTPLFAADESEHLRSDWAAIQTGFVDEPRQCVEKADQLVGRVVQRLAESLSQERSTLEGPWSKGDDVSTEDLRVALQHYRSFFHRLLLV
jgi:hypothetical protein